MSLAPGDVLHGKYRIERVLGEGGMGVVMLATHLELDQPVALKFLLPQALEHPEVVERFAREARAAAKIRGANAVKVLDVGRTDDGTPFMVMEYLEGRDLSSVLAIQGRLEAPRAVDLVLEACEGLAEAHAAGIVHRDLKPSNLFLASTPDGGTVVKVLDFGISKLAEQKDLTRTNAMMGTAYYMSPEQLTTPKLVDARSDIWSLGVVLYVLLSGSQPFDADTLPEVIALILKNEPAPLGVIVEALPIGLGAVVHRCFASRPEARFRDLAEMAEALAPFGSEGAAKSARRIARVLSGGLPTSSVDAASLAPRGSSAASEALGATTVANPATTKRSAEWSADDQATMQGPSPATNGEASAEGARGAAPAELSDHGAPAVAHTSIQPGPASAARPAENAGGQVSRGGRRALVGALLLAGVAGAVYVFGARSTGSSPSEPARAADSPSTTPEARPSVTHAEATPADSIGAGSAPATARPDAPTVAPGPSSDASSAAPASTAASSVTPTNAPGTAPRTPSPSARPAAPSATTKVPTATAIAAPPPTSNPLEMQLK
jgi:eukaryotic-like serine/threonine-protein kinase